MSDVKITVRADGPYHIKGPVTLVDPDGNEFPAAEEVWLCRCGQSARKPFCDGAHKRQGWKSVVDARPGARSDQ